MLIPSSVIYKKREGQKLSKDEISFFINGFLNGDIADYQMSALLMAIFFKGMDDEETIFLTEIMLNSGDKIDLSKIKGFKFDKHSTGGVGDKISLILTPIIASFGLYVPMISGRGLGFTGGTLDKLESIPNFNTQLNTKEFENVVSTVGCAIIGQTDNIVPADKRIYALRDVTSTVESIPLICSSILSKKFAEDINGIVFDIKVGNGAFMKRKEDAIRLANNLIKISNAFNKKAACVLTNMNYPLGYAVGNWLEVVETVHCLKGIEVPDVMEITHTIAGVILTMGMVSKGIYEGVELSKEAIKSGIAYNKFLEMISAQGGDTSYIENLEKYDSTKYAIEVKSDKEGFISNINAHEIGLLGIEIGIGRKKVADIIDHKSGIIFRKTIGDTVEVGDIIATCYTEKENVLKLAKNRIFNSITISNTPIKKDSPIISIMGDVNL